MNEDVNIDHGFPSRQGSLFPFKSRRFRSFEMSEMTSLIVAAIAAALVAGLLVLPVTMPGQARFVSQASSDISGGLTAMVTAPVSLRT